MIIYQFDIMWFLFVTIALQSTPFRVRTTVVAFIER